MFPLHLEKQTEKIFANFFRRFADDYNRRIFAAVKKSYKPDVRHDSINSASSYPVTSPSGIYDLIRLLEDERKHGDVITKERLEKLLKQNYSLFDRAAAQKTHEFLTKLKDPIHSGSFGEQKDGEYKYKPSVFVDDLIRSRARSGVEMLDGLNREHSEEIFKSAYDGIMKGDSLVSIKNAIRETTGANESKARFWARDQAGDINAQVNKYRQNDAGFPGYIWRSVKDARVRDRHIENHGKFFTWEEGAQNLIKPGARHPGEDYRCRCYPEPSRNPPSEEIQSEESAGGISSREEDIKKVEAITGGRRETGTGERESEAEKRSGILRFPGSFIEPVYQTKISDAWKLCELDNPGNWTVDSIKELKKAMTKTHGIPAKDIVSGIYGASQSGIFSTKTVSEIIQEFIDFVPEDGIRANRFAKINIQIGSFGKKLLGFYENGVISISRNSIRTKNQLRETVFHEMMHWFHDDMRNSRGDDFRAKIASIFAERTAGHGVYSDGRGGYFRDDEWWDKYAGRVYSFEKNKGVEPGSEVATTYMQLLGNQDKLLKILSNEKKYPRETLQILKSILEFFE